MKHPASRKLAKEKLTKRKKLNAHKYTPLKKMKVTLKKRQNLLWRTVTFKKVRIFMGKNNLMGVSMSKKYKNMKIHREK